MDAEGPRAAGELVERLLADYKLARFARSLLETRSTAAAVGRRD